MPYTVRQLITRAYYLSGIVSEQYQTISGFQIGEGLGLLNELLSLYALDKQLIPYYKDDTFENESGVEKYFISGLILCDALTFNFQTVRYCLERLERKAYFAVARANNVSTFPSYYYVERTGGGSNIFLYPKPDPVFEFNIRGKFALLNVTLDQILVPDDDDDLNDYPNMGPEVVTYLTYALASYICEHYNITFQPLNKKRLERMEKGLFETSPADFSITKQTALNDGSEINYAIANLSRGYLPG